MSEANTPQRPLDRIEFRMFGTLYLGDEQDLQNISSLLNAFEGIDLFHPTSGNKDERRSKPYDRDWILTETEQQRLGSVVYLKRQKSAKYMAMVNMGPKPSVVIWINPKLTPKHYATLIEWCHTLTQAFKPDYACLAFIPKIERPYPTELDKQLDSLLYASTVRSVSYPKFGPPGIGLYTWLSTHFVDQIGRDFLMATPNVTVTDTDWDSVFIQIDCDELPAELPYEKLMTLWLPAMDHLWQSDIFIVQKTDERGKIRRAGKGPKCVVNGYIDKKYHSRLRSRLITASEYQAQQRKKKKT